METVIPNEDTINYLTGLKVYDIFPSSINSLYNKNLTEEQKNFEKEKYLGFIGTDLLEIIEGTDVNNNAKYILEKNTKDKIKLNQNNIINCICSYNNVLLIANHNEIKIYDISENFDCCGSIKMPGYENIILA